MVRNIEVIIAENITNALNEQNMSQSDLAIKTGISRTTINSICKQKQDSIRLSNRIEIAKALGMTIEELEQDPHAHAACQSVIGMLHDQIQKLESQIPNDIRNALEKASDAQLSAIRKILKAGSKKRKESAG